MCSIIKDVLPNCDLEPQLGRVAFCVYKNNTVFVAHEHGRCIEDIQRVAYGKIPLHRAAEELKVGRMNPKGTTQSHK